MPGNITAEQEQEVQEAFSLADKNGTWDGVHTDEGGGDGDEQR